jgi:hypothetical protein
MKSEHHHFQDGRERARGTPTEKARAPAHTRQARRWKSMRPHDNYIIKQLKKAGWTQVEENLYMDSNRSAGDTLWLNTLHVGLITPTDLLDLTKPHFRGELITGFPICHPEPHTLLRPLRNSWCLLYFTPVLLPHTFLEAIYAAFPGVGIVDLAAIQHRQTPFRTAWLVWCVNPESASSLMVACKSDRLLWKALASGTLHGRAGVSVTTGSLSKARLVATRATTVLFFQTEYSFRYTRDSDRRNGASSSFSSSSSCDGGNGPWSNPSLTFPPSPAQLYE